MWVTQLDSDKSKDNQMVYLRDAMTEAIECTNCGYTSDFLKDALSGKLKKSKDTYKD